jgi:hypothetical protein
MSRLRRRIERLEEAAAPAERPLAIAFYGAAGAVVRLLVHDPPGLVRPKVSPRRDADPATPLGGLLVVQEYGAWMARHWDCLHAGACRHTGGACDGCA